MIEYDEGVREYESKEIESLSYEHALYSRDAKK